LIDLLHPSSEVTRRVPASVHPARRQRHCLIARSDPLIGQLQFLT
jgi:hypothetical protein